MDERRAPRLLPVTADELGQAVSQALRFHGRKHSSLAGEILGEDRGRAAGPQPDPRRTRGDAAAAGAASAGAACRDARGAVAVPLAKTKTARGTAGLASLRNVGKATLADFRLLGITTVGELAAQEADALYAKLCETTGRRHDPCAHDVFAATIHEARTGEALDWWAFTAGRKARQAAGDFPRPMLG